MKNMKAIISKGIEGIGETDIDETKIFSVNNKDASYGTVVNEV